MRALLAVLLAAVTAAAAEPVAISFGTTDGGTVSADLYDSGGDGVVLVHGAAFDKGSWVPLATTLRDHGLRVLAVDLRGYGASKAGTKGDAGRPEDVLAAVRELHRRGARRVSVVGASMGGRVVADAVVAAKADEVYRVVLLSPAALDDPARLRGPMVFVVSADEPSAARIRDEFARAPEPKRLLVIPGSAHAQHVFATSEGPHLTAALVDILTGK